MSHALRWSRTHATLPWLLLCACASARPDTDTSRMVMSETLDVGRAIREELGRERIPLDPGSTTEHVRSDLFDPAVVWRGDRLAERIACVDGDGKPLAPVGRILIRVAISADARGNAPIGDPTAVGTSMRAAAAYTQVSLRSTGHMTHETAQGRCALSETYAAQLLERITGRFPQRLPPRRVTLR